MRSIQISTAVFAALWAKRKEGEDNEDDILRGILELGPTADVGSRTANQLDGFVDGRNGFAVPEGFQIFRIYKGKKFSASATKGRWHLDQDGNFYPSLHKLSRAIVSGRENAWENWKYRDDSGQERKLTELRDQRRIIRRNSGGDLSTDTWKS